MRPTWRERWNLGMRSASSMENGIKSVKQNAPEAKTKDLTI